ncbi:Mitofusin-2 [Holothuria leucospilota]|uniref:Mitofusin-2 n=1 Tax=Holothuria leucospilota TaxID=206669 RepID=A0A9Q1CDU6_HOLLE|nr:Mitofusin-2 [Holothuria leucospilota]
MDAASMRRGSGTGKLVDPDVNSHHTPLKLFVDAKKKVHKIYSDVSSHIQDSITFLNGLPEESSVATPEQVTKMDNFGSQVRGIQEVLARDHMKVAFFGRTSNGKSSVINAMLRDKVLPTGLGHTTDCFLVVKGSETDDAYLQVAGSDVKMNVESVSHLAHALASERLQDQNTIVNIYWPKSRCHLLQNDVVLMDSPGTDVEASLDEWIDGRCLDADVFVLVSNAESTLMRTEKSFFHKVSERLSKPNIFILNNRWDASASEPEYMEAVKQQHLQRNIQFLADELKVVSRQQAEDRVFFVSAKEALIARCSALPNTPDSSNFQMAEGYQARLFEFENFERKFEECISHSAVKTKFEQHAKQGRQIVTFSQEILAEVHDSASKKRSTCIEKRKEQADRLEYVTKQLDLLANECKDQIRDVVEKAESRVSSAMTDEIERLNILVDQFNEPFSSDSLVIKVYKEKLQKHLEAGIGHNLHARCSGTVLNSVKEVQTQMTERMSALLPDDSKERMSGVFIRRDFDLNYRLDCQYLFADFKENLQFKFSLGLTAMMERFLGRSGTKAALTGFANVIPRALPPADESSPASQTSDQDLTVAMMTGLASLTSRASMGVVVVSGVVWRAVGWRVLAVAGGIYIGLYLYERFTWTNKAKEKKFKGDFVEYATEKLQLLVNFTSSNLSHQIQQELSSTYAQLALEAGKARDNLQRETVELEAETKKLETIINKAKMLRNKAGWLDTELEMFITGFILH